MVPYQGREAQRSLCYCGVIVIGVTVCPDCAGTMSAALLRAARGRRMDSGLPTTQAAAIAESEAEPVAV